MVIYKSYIVSLTSSTPISPPLHCVTRSVEKEMEKGSSRKGGKLGIAKNSHTSFAGSEWSSSIAWKTET